MSSRPGLRGLISARLATSWSRRAGGENPEAAGLPDRDGRPPDPSPAGHLSGWWVAWPTVRLRRRGDHPVAAPTRAIATAPTSATGQRCPRHGRLPGGRLRAPRRDWPGSRWRPATPRRPTGSCRCTRAWKRTAGHSSFAARSPTRWATTRPRWPSSRRSSSDGRPIVRSVTIVERSRAELAILDPRWRPDLGPAVRTIARSQTGSPGGSCTC